MIFRAAIPEGVKNPIEWASQYITKDSTMTIEDGVIVIETAGEFQEPSATAVVQTVDIADENGLFKEPFDDQLAKDFEKIQPDLKKYVSAILPIFIKIDKEQREELRKKNPLFDGILALTEEGN